MKQASGEAHPRRLDAHRRELVLGGLGAQFSNLVFGRVRFQERVVDESGQSGVGRRGGQPEPFGAAFDERPHDLGTLTMAEVVTGARGPVQPGQIGLHAELSHDRIGHELGESIQIPVHSLR